MTILAAQASTGEQKALLAGLVLAQARLVAAVSGLAPLLLLDSLFDPNSTTFNMFRGVPNVPMLIWNTSDLALPDAFTRAWGASFVLLVLILLANILARVVTAMSRRKGA